MKAASISEKIGYMSKSSKEKQTMISISEAYSIWTTLVNRYDAVITVKTFEDFVNDDELKKILMGGIKVLDSQIKVLEKLMKDFSIPMPDRPPEDSNTDIDINAISDKFVFRAIYTGLSSAMFKHLSSYQRAHSSYLREIFRNILNQELDLYDLFFEYGKLKAYLNSAPSFRV